MKHGRTLQELAAELDRQMKTKKDYITPVEKMRAVATIERGAPIFGINLDQHGFFPTTKIANEQLAGLTKIPMPYFRRMEAEAPGLLSINVNRWLEDEAKAGTRRMARTLDGSLRALLSDAFRPMDNYDLANVILPEMIRLDLMVTSCEVTETRMYIKAFHKSLQDQIPVGLQLGVGHSKIDAVAAGLSATNSEVGKGSLRFESGIYTFGCTNMATFGTNIKKYHVGQRAEMSPEVYAMLTNETKRKQDIALWGSVKDVMNAAFTPEGFAGNVEKLKAAAADQIEKPITEVIEVMQERFGWNETEGASILDHLSRGGDISRYGLHSAVTRMSADVESYDRATELERDGGRIIELSPSEWMAIAA